MVLSFDFCKLCAKSINCLSIFQYNRKIQLVKPHICLFESSLEVDAGDPKIMKIPPSSVLGFLSLPIHLWIKALLSYVVSCKLGTLKLTMQVQIVNLH